MGDAGLFGAVVAATTGALWLRRWRQHRHEHAAAVAAAAVPAAVPAASAPAPVQPAQLILTDPDAFAATAQAIVAAGPDHLVLILDFDRTITTMWMDDARTERGATCHGIVESTRGPELLAAARALNAKYYPAEVDPDLPLERKVPLMEEWYSAVHELLLRDGLRREDVVDSVAKARLRLRPGAADVFAWAAAHSVPLLVFSAGIGNVLLEVLRQRLPGGLPACVHCVSNMMKFADDGALTGFSSPLIHMFNKHAGVLDPGVLRALSDRRHVIVVGDSLGDATMAEGLPSVAHELRYGLLNDGAERLLPAYAGVFDAIITGDAPLWPLLELLRRIAP